MVSFVALCALLGAEYVAAIIAVIGIEALYELINNSGDSDLNSNNSPCLT